MQDGTLTAGAPPIFVLMWLCVCCLQYEPELFPGLIYRMKDPKIVLLIFVSGKVVLTGGWWLLLPTLNMACGCCRRRGIGGDLVD
jgi:hypothetical protein